MGKAQSIEHDLSDVRNADRGFAAYDGGVGELVIAPNLDYDFIAGPDRIVRIYWTRGKRLERGREIAEDFVAKRKDRVLRMNPV